MLRFPCVLLTALLVLGVSPVTAQPSPDTLDTATLDVLPDRTTEALATLLLATGDDPSLLSTEYRGAGAPQFVVDGLRARRTDGLPQAALAMLTVPTGYVSPRLGNALGSFVEVETRGTPREDLGRAEGLGGLDSYGYGLVSGGAGVTSGAFRLYGAGTFERGDDLDPRAYGTPALPADELAALRESPQVLRLDRAMADAAGFNPSLARYNTGDSYYIPFPAGLQDPDLETVAGALGLPDASAFVTANPLSSLAVRSAEVPLTNASPGAKGDRFRGHLALDVTPSERLRLRFSGQGFRETSRAFSTALAFASPEAIPSTRDEYWRGLAEAEADLGAGTLSLAASAERATFVRHDGRFSDDIADVIRYGDIDDPANATAAAYRRYNVSDETYEPAFEDGSLNVPSPYSTFAGVGAAVPSYAHETAEALRLAAGFRQRVGAFDLAIGAEAETQTFRGVEVGALSLARFVNDGQVETPIVDADGDGTHESGIDVYNELPADIARRFVSAYGYDYLGTEEASEGTALADFYDALDDNTLMLAPRRPSILAAFAEGVWEGADVTVRGGLRVARFSSNAIALLDPFAFVDIYRANDLAAGAITDPVTGERILGPAGGVPASVPNSAALYVSFDDQVVGYRDIEGVFYDATGQRVSSSEVTANGRPIAVGGGSQLSAEAFTDAPTTVRVLPRVEAELRAPTGTVFTVFLNSFARQPDPALAFPTLADFENVRSGQGSAASGSLRPETLTEVGTSVRQRIGREGSMRGELGVTAFLRRYRDMVRLETSTVSFPTATTTPFNSRQENVPGATLHGRLLSGRLDARGAVTVLRETVDEARLSGTNEVIAQEAVTADAVAAVAVVTEATDGPSLGAFHPFGNVRLGAVLRVAAGDTYRPRSVAPLSVPFESRTTVGELQRGPARTRLDLRLSKGFQMASSTLEASFEVVNLLSQTNALFVYPTTGLPNDDGFLATSPSQVLGLGTEAEQEAYRSLYSARVRDPLNVGRPRLLRIGLRVTL
ncbi:MAG: hypothetical protein AAGI52_03015 [Bacteroidota bacterium]